MDAVEPGVAKYSNLFSHAHVGAFTCRNRVKYAACSVSNFNTLRDLKSQIANAPFENCDL